VSRPGGPPWSILLTSAHPGEGKTTVALNLAVTLAQIGKRVLLIDADSRRSRLHRALGIECEDGLSNDLSETGPIRLRVRPTGVPGLDLLPGGPIPPNPADLLDSERLQLMLREIAARGYEHVVFDSPPVLPVADAAILAGRVDVVAMVVHAGRTDRDALKHAAMRLRQVKAHLVGCVLNRVNDEEHGSYAGYYGPGAASETRTESSGIPAAGRSRRIQT
jgi:capsular exopolysaccharide synthesis family protein